jgi:tetratricopeptide (TPR) repeat protein
VLFLPLILIANSIAQFLSPTVDPDQILRQAEARLRQDSANPRLLVLRGVALGQLGRDREALESLERALTISPRFMTALQAAAEIAYRIHDARANNYLSRILQQDPNNAPAHGMSGALAFEARDCAAATTQFAAAEILIHDDPLALAQWGECLVVIGQAASGAARLRAALTLQPETAPGAKNLRYDLALALHESGKDDDALEIARALPDEACRENLLGFLYAAQDKVPEAIAALRKSAELDPKNEQTYIDLASVCLDHQSFDVAEDVVNIGLANLPDSAALYALRGAIAAQTSHVEQSAADFERASRLQPDRSYGDLGLSLLLRQQDQIDQAITLIRLRLAKSPNDATLNFLLADLLVRQSSDDDRSQVSEAHRLLATAIRLDPNMAKAHAALGKLLFQCGDPGRAATSLTRALDLDPSDRVALNQYVLVLRRLGKSSEASAAAQRLRDVLAEDRKSEVQKNRYRLVRLSPSSTVRTP